MVASMEWNTLGSASHRNQSEHIVGPLREGARESVVTLDAAGRCDIGWSAREPLLLAVLKQSLDQRSLRVTATLDPDGAPVALAEILFAAYTEFGASLVCRLPGVDADTRKAAPLVIDFGAVEILADGTEQAVDADEVTDWIEVSVVEGLLGRLSYMLGAEHMRMRRIARETLAVQNLETARDDALDRIGAAVAVPRFTDEIDFDIAAGEIVTRSEDAGGQPIIESDDSYRTRLELYTPWLVGSRTRILERLNGDGAEPGLLGRVGIPDPIELLETDSPFSVAIHCLGVGGDAIRLTFLEYLRDHYLLAPEQALEQNRFLSADERQRQADLRASLNTGFAFQNNHFIAPMLASAFDRVVRCRAALEVVPVPLNVLLAQDDSGGSRYELGLGANIDPLSEGQINALRQAVLDPARAPAADAEVEGLLQTMATGDLPTFADDPEAAWFFNACGLRTVHRLDPNTIYVSHLPTSGLAISGVSTLPPDNAVELTAKFHSPGDPGPNAVLFNGMQEAADDWADAGQANWTVVANPVDSWNQAVVNADANNVFQAAGLPSFDAVNEMSERLQQVSPELLTVIQLAPAQAAAIIAGGAAAIEPLEQLKTILSDAGLVSALPLVTAGGQVTLTISVIGLPSVGTNLAPRRAIGYRWYVVPIQGEAGAVGAIGSRTTYSSANAPALVAVVTVGYARNPDLTDPYEFQVRLPDETLLDIKQYEYLMNALMHMHPVGVEVNTWRLRQNHVDLDGDDDPDPLGPALARTFRHFRRPRHRGELGVGLNDN